MSQKMRTFRQQDSGQNINVMIMGKTVLSVRAADLDFLVQTEDVHHQLTQNLKQPLVLLTILTGTTQVKLMGGLSHITWNSIAKMGQVTQRN